MRDQVARKDGVRPDRTRARTGTVPARFVITSEPSGYEPVNSNPLVEQKEKSRIVTFNTPLDAQCMSADGTWHIDCQVLAVWADGASLKVKQPKALTKSSEFVLLFTSSQKPVLRRCKRVLTRGRAIGVEYCQDRASYLMHMEYDT